MTATYDEVARRQLGLITHQQLTESGWTRDEIRGALKNRLLIPMRRGVYRTAGTPITREVVWLAAALAAGDAHVLSRLTAAAIWDFKSYPEPDRIQLLTDSTSRSRFEGVQCQRTVFLPRSHVTTTRGLPVTDPARTLVDTCGDVPFEIFAAAARDAVRRTILRPIDYVRCVEQVPVSGRRKSRPAKLLLTEFVPGYDPGDSDAELDIVDILVDAGYPRPDQQIGVRTEGRRYKIDVGYKSIKQGFEFLSEKYHLNAESFHADPERTSRLQRAGWQIWPVTSRTSKAEILLTASTAFGHLPGLRTAS